MRVKVPSHAPQNCSFYGGGTSNHCMESHSGLDFRDYTVRIGILEFAIA